MFTSQRISNTFFFSRPGNCHGAIVQEIEGSYQIRCFNKKKKVLKNSQNLENFSKIFFQLWFPLQCKLI